MEWISSAFPNFRSLDIQLGNNRRNSIDKINFHDYFQVVTWLELLESRLQHLQGVEFVSFNRWIQLVKHPWSFCAHKMTENIYFHSAIVLRRESHWKSCGDGCGLCGSHAHQRWSPRIPRAHRASRLLPQLRENSARLRCRPGWKLCTCKKCLALYRIASFHIHWAGMFIFRWNRKRSMYSNFKNRKNGWACRKHWINRKLSFDYQRCFTFLERMKLTKWKISHENIFKFQFHQNRSEIKKLISFHDWNRWRIWQTQVMKLWFGCFQEVLQAL